VTEQINGAEQELSRETDAARHKQMEQMLADMKKIASDSTTLQSLGAHEGEVAASLQDERAVLNELNDKLNRMEQALETPRPSTKQP
jgi:hypothetical protein